MGYRKKSKSGHSSDISISSSSISSKSSHNSSGKNSGKKNQISRSSSKFSLLSTYLSFRNDGSSKTEIELELDENCQFRQVYDSIAEEHGFSTDERDHDLQVLEKNRIRTVKDARKLSAQSWIDIGFVPLLRDAIMSKIKPMVQRDDDGSAKNAETQKVISASTEKKQQRKSSGLALLLGIGSSSEISRGIDTISISPNNPDRLRVELKSGQKYECDRWCPHKGVDLAMVSININLFKNIINGKFQ